MQAVSKKRIGIIRGGAGGHYKSSLKHGGDILSHIFENLGDKYKVIDILVDKENIWHVNGLPIIPADLLHKTDVVWNASHPSFSTILNNLSIPEIGAAPFSHVLQSNREMLRDYMKKLDVSMPRSIVLPIYRKDFSAKGGSASGGDGSINRYATKKAKEIHEKFAAPWLVRSFTSHPNMAVHLAHTFNELVAGIEDGVRHGTSILVEEFIVGKVASLHAVSDFRGEKIYVFPPANVFGSLTGEEKEKLIPIARDLYQHIGVKHYLRSSFIVNKRGKVYFLDMDFTIDPKKDSHFSQVCESVGTKMQHVVEHILERA